jgi:hypothetical protein
VYDDGLIELCAIRSTVLFLGCNDNVTCEWTTTLQCRGVLEPILPPLFQSSCIPIGHLSFAWNIELIEEPRPFTLAQMVGMSWSQLGIVSPKMTLSLSLKKCILE